MERVDSGRATEGWPFWGKAKPRRKKFRQGFQCPGQESNLHALRHTHLKRARLPVPPPGHLVGLCLKRCANIRKINRTVQIFREKNIPDGDIAAETGCGGAGSRLPFRDGSRSGWMGTEVRERGDGAVVSDSPEADVPECVVWRRKSLRLVTGGFCAQDETRTHTD